MKGWTPQAARYFLTDLILQLCSLIQMAAMFQDKYVFSQCKHSANPVFPPLKVLLSFA